MKNTFRIPILVCLLIIGGTCAAAAQTLDISSGGTPTITGTLNGSVVGSSSTQNDLVVTVDFGEVSPASSNSLVKITVPIAVRSSDAYKVTVSASGTSSSNPQALQRSDIGFGLANWRAMGSNSKVCKKSEHIFYPPYSGDPAGTRTFTSSGRAAYAATLSNLNSSTTILSGPRLSTGSATRSNNDGYIFDAVFIITPQFFAAGSLSMILTFTISDGPNVPC